MKRKKYDIHKDFEKLSNTNPPINVGFAKMIQFFLKPLFSLQKSTKDCKVEKKTINLCSKKVRFLIFNPTNIKDNSRCLIYYHGGGFMLPAAPYHYENAMQYAIGANCRVFVPDYPLAPKNKFPIPVNVCFEFYKHILENSKKYNIDRDNIIVGGDSAGAQLASIVCMMSSDKEIQVPNAQLLMYPVVGVNPPTQSMIEFDDTGMCNNKDFEKYCKLYFKNETDKNNRYVSPLNQEDLSMYPATYIETAEFDCFRDEGILFADELNLKGVDVVTNHTKRTLHAYDMAENSEIVQRSILKRIEFLNREFNKE